MNNIRPWIMSTLLTADKSDNRHKGKRDNIKHAKSLRPLIIKEIKKSSNPPTRFESTREYCAALKTLLSIEKTLKKGI